MVETDEHAGIVASNANTAVNQQGSLFTALRRPLHMPGSYWPLLAAAEIIEVAVLTTGFDLT